MREALVLWSSYLSGTKSNGNELNNLVIAITPDYIKMRDSAYKLALLYTRSNMFHKTRGALLGSVFFDSHDMHQYAAEKEELLTLMKTTEFYASYVRIREAIKQIRLEKNVEAINESECYTYDSAYEAMRIFLKTIKYSVFEDIYSFDATGAFNELNTILDRQVKDLSLPREFGFNRSEILFLKANQYWKNGIVYDEDDLENLIFKHRFHNADVLTDESSNIEVSTDPFNTTEEDNSAFATRLHNDAQTHSSPVIPLSTQEAIRPITTNQTVSASLYLQAIGASLLIAGLALLAIGVCGFAGLPVGVSLLGAAITAAAGIVVTGGVTLLYRQGFFNNGQTTPLATTENVAFAEQRNSQPT